ncbi:hypothetical protein D3C86_1741720 [compost metagenome]
MGLLFTSFRVAVTVTKEPETTVGLLTVKLEFANEAGPGTTVTVTVGTKVTPSTETESNCAVPAFTPVYVVV